MRKDNKYNKLKEYLILNFGTSARNLNKKLKEQEEINISLIKENEQLKLKIKAIKGICSEKIELIPPMSVSEIRNN